jgi:hypothetical protein
VLVRKVYGQSAMIIEDDIDRVILSLLLNLRNHNYAFSDDRDDGN